MVTVGEGKGGVTWESSPATYVTVCEVDSQGKFAVWSRELKAGAMWWLGAGDGERREGALGDGLEGRMYAYDWFVLMYGGYHPNTVIIE